MATGIVDFKINPADIQRIKFTQLGTQRAGNFASRYTATGAMRGGARTIIMMAFENNAPVLQNPEDHPEMVPGALKASIRGYPVGAHVEFRCLYYGIILSEGNKAYTVYPKDRNAPGKTVQITRQMNLLTPKGTRITKTITYNYVTHRTLTIRYDGFKTHPAWVPHPASDGSKWIPKSVAEASNVLYILQDMFGRKTIRIVEDSSEFELAEDWIQRTADSLAAGMIKQGWKPK